MTLGDKIAWDDTVLPFQLDNSDIRGRVARLDGVLGGILRAARLPAGGRGAGGGDGAVDGADRPDDQAALEAVAAGAVERPGAHDRDRLLRPRRGRGARAHPRLRQLRRGSADRGRAFAQIGEGYFAIMIDQGKGMTPVPGHHAPGRRQPARLRRGLFRPVRADPDPLLAELRALDRGRAADEHWRAGGVMLQHMPKASPFAAAPAAAAARRAAAARGRRARRARRARTGTARISCWTRWTRSS